MTTTENSRADALTIPRDLLNDLIEDVQSFADQVPCREREKAFRADLLARARAFAGSPSLQPAAAPIDSGTVSVACFSGSYPRGTITYSQPAPSPADERAAFEAWAREEYGGDEALLRFGKESGEEYRYSGTSDAWAGWQARAASASATGAEGALIERLKLLLSGDAAFCRTIVARAAIEQAIAILSRSPAMAAEAVAIPAEVIAWRDAWQAYIDASSAYNAHLKYVHDNCPFGTSVDAQHEAMVSAHRKAMELLKPMHAALSGAIAAPQPSQADARVGLTDEQRDLIKRAANICSDANYQGTARELRKFLAAHPGQPEPRAEVADVQWWLAELDQYGNPKLSDGAHSERAGADKAMYLIKSLGLDNKGKRWAVARVELSEPRPNADGVNAGAVESCRAMVDAARTGA